MDLTRLRRQDGFVRESVKYLAILVLVAVVVFDAVALLQVQRSVRSNASDAAREARASYVQMGDADLALETAKSFLEANDSTWVAGSFARPPGAGYDRAVFTVTARRHADTYVFRYLAYVPGLDKTVKKITDPQATETSE